MPSRLFPNMPRNAFVTALLAALISAGLPGPSATAAEAGRTETEEQRLDRVAYDLRAASAGKCANAEMLTGFALHDIAAYDADQRDLVDRHFRFGREFGIRDIIAGSVAERAGFQPGDVITAVNGASLSEFETALITPKASYDRIASFEQYLGTALANGTAELTVRRGDKILTLALVGQPGCGGKPVLYTRGGLNAWSDGRYVAVTSTMMRFAGNDSELAFVIAHEMSHNILKHAERLRGKSMLLASLGIGSGAIKTTEIEADEMAAEIMIAAGMPIDGALSLLKRASGRMPIALALATTHPGIARRIRIVTLAGSRYADIARMALGGDLPAVSMGLTDLDRKAQSFVDLEDIAMFAPHALPTPDIVPDRIAAAPVQPGINL